MKNKNDQERKNRVHKLIQRGGLLNLSGLPQQCDISEGEDLQNDLEGHEKAATLLGILIEASETLLKNNDTHQMEQFRKLGLRKMKQAAAKYY
jgi:hypothetical protein